MAAAPAPPAAELGHADAYCRRLARRHDENFTVASAVLPADLRLHLTRIYAYCRVTDDLGDESRSVSRLVAWREAVEGALAGGAEPSHPVLLALRETVAVCAIPADHFLDLIAANLQDQRVVRYASWDELTQYCRLSAAPVGRMVLAVLGIRGERAAALADDVCIGLQLANFAQDVAVDAALGRCYLPDEALREGGTEVAVRAMCDRAASLLASGRQLEALTAGRLRAQIAMYRLGGTAILDAIRRAGYRTDAVRPRVSRPVKARLAVEAVSLLAKERAAARTDIVAAQRACQRLARRNAANFYWGFIALPRAQRTAIYSLYDFARQVDDAVDVPGGDPDLALGEVRARLDRALEGRPDDEVMAVVARTVATHRVPRAELDELVAGVACDLVPRAYATWDDLAEYCRLVASTVGRMCVRVFGFDDPIALNLADELGRAMQLTNILRDVRGDLELGRVYLPSDELAAFDVDREQLSGERPPPGWNDFVAFQAARARDLFARGLEVDRYIPARAGVCVRTMAGLYQEILGEIELDPAIPLRRRLSLPPTRKLAVLCRAATGPRRRHPAAAMLPGNG